MTTALEKTLKRELQINGKVYVVAISPEGLKLTVKGHRKGLELQWEALVSGEAALAVALNASVGQFVAGAAREPANEAVVRPGAAARRSADADEARSGAAAQRSNDVDEARPGAAARRSNGADEARPGAATRRPNNAAEARPGVAVPRPSRARVRRTGATNGAPGVIAGAGKAVRTGAVKTQSRKAAVPAKRPTADARPKKKSSAADARAANGRQTRGRS